MYCLVISQNAHDSSPLVRSKAGLDNSDEATKDIEIVIGDMDGDGNVNAADIVKLVNKVMNP